MAKIKRAVFDSEAQRKFAEAAKPPEVVQIDDMTLEVGGEKVSLDRFDKVCDAALRIEEATAAAIEYVALKRTLASLLAKIDRMMPEAIKDLQKTSREIKRRMDLLGGTMADSLAGDQMRLDEAVADTEPEDLDGHGLGEGGE
jgi:hypothetical protein